jgi:flavin-dependent dehydrogenase
VKRVAVLGGGPAGSLAAERLAAAGLETVVFDEKLAWEKPCGGGLTFKAYGRYPFLIENDTPKKLVTATCLTAPQAGAVEMRLARPLVIYSRYDLNQLLLRRAEKAGARLEQTRVLGLDHKSGGWTVRTKSGAMDTDFCVIATGARNPLREFGTEWMASDTMGALGYFVPGEQDQIDIQFLPKLNGYIWVFPRCGHLSVGICGKGEPAQALRARLDRYMHDRDISHSGATFYSHVLPALEPSAWRQNRVGGDGWLAVGDAAGLVDPITGEGLYYAMRSGELASQVILDDAQTSKAQAYQQVLRCDFAGDLEYAAVLAKHIFTGRFLFKTVPERMIRFMRRSERFRLVMQDIFAGTQPYQGLRERLFQNLNGTLQKMAGNFFLSKVMPQSIPID